MIFRAKAPLRIGLAGGGTDVSPYSDMYGGAILNATITLYANASLEFTNDKSILIEALDRNEREVYNLSETLPVTGCLDLAKGIINRLRNDFQFPDQGFTLSTFVDAPAGSGLGTSSTLVVTIISVFAEALNLPLGEYDLAHYAYEIERIDLKMSGGKQDQYAATFGGFNFMEFYENDKVIVNPLRIRRETLYELENNIILYFTATNRESAKIIIEQQKNVIDKNTQSIEAMHNLKKQAVMMKEAILKGNVDQIGEILDYGFKQKKLMAYNISNPLIEDIYETALKAGASGGKISGAGGGGFMFFYCPFSSRYKVIQSLKKFGGHFRNYSFTEHGQISWKTK